MQGSLTRRGFVALAASAPLAIVTFSRPAAADATDDALDALAKARSDLKTLIAPFDQVRVVGLLAEDVKSKGELNVVLPDQLRWELFAPDSIVFWILKSGVYYKDAKGKVGKAPPGAMGALAGDLLTFVGGDIKKLKPSYDITASLESDGPVKIVALPKNDATKKAIKRLEVVTNKERWGISKILIEEPNGDSSSITFGTNKKNAKIDAAKMKPPA